MSVFVKHPNAINELKKILKDIPEEDKLFATTSEMLMCMMIKLAYELKVDCGDYDSYDIKMLKTILFSEVYNKGIS